MVPITKYYKNIISRLQKSYISNKKDRKMIEDICRCNSNKAPIRFLLSCLYAKIDKNSYDIRKPYTEISGANTFSGRHIDETKIQELITSYKLPCNSTTAYLTPAFRNIDRPITSALVLVGRPRNIYNITIKLIEKVYNKNITPSNLFKEIFRFLLIIKSENENRINQLISNIGRSTDSLPLSSEQIINLLVQHLKCKNSSRLPVLIIASAYNTISDKFGERASPLQAHNAADSQTGSLGDVEITLMSDDNIVTTYEMKVKKVTIHDINIAIEKISKASQSLDNYLFVTTDVIDDEVIEYAKSFYESIGVEIAVLDCIGFIKHFLHLFHRFRTHFLDNYQSLVLNEPNSSVGQPLKEAFLALRQTAESDLT
ncbi:MAG: restriction endonuclease, SacI family [Ignavibacteria bacterium]|nr:restriction endonuclease, SacI family [Ignavibacteria bacterium]